MTVLCSHREEQLPHQQHPERSIDENTKIEGVSLWLSGELKKG